MKMRLNGKHRIVYVLIIFYLISCGKPNKQETSGREAIKVLKKNSPLDEQKKERSKVMMMDIYKQLNFIPEMDYFINIVNQCKDNHIFVNADNQGYIIVAVNNKGIKQVPGSDQARLIDATGSNHSYQLKFLLHHIIKCPRQIYPGIIYTSLAGNDVYISDNRSDLRLKGKTYPIKSAFKMSEDLEIIAVDSVLYR